jgi:hypothetical protein
MMQLRRCNIRNRRRPMELVGVIFQAVCILSNRIAGGTGGEE